MTYLTELELALMSQSQRITYMNDLWRSYQLALGTAREQIGAHMEQAKDYCSHRDGRGQVAEPVLVSNWSAKTCPYCCRNWERLCAESPELRSKSHGIYGIS